MRFEKSAEMSHSVAGGISAVLNQATVGSDISSATHGSSVASVAGKKRAPTKQWATAVEHEAATNKSANANAREALGLRSIGILH
jgi:4-hydroxyphenylpyruvate dioxygenase-like putative hemolysin